MRKLIKSICEMCGSGYGSCGIDVYAEDDKVVKIEGTKGYPVNDGKLCPKGIAGVQMQNSPDRLLYPMKRVGEKGSGKFERISWREAIDILSGTFKSLISTHGPEAIGWMKGSGGGWQFAWDACQRFMNAIDAPNLMSTGHNCHFARIAAHICTFGTEPEGDYEHSRVILLWGYNPFNTALSSHGIRIMKAKKRGVPLIVIGTRFDKTAAKADLFVQVRPGADGALALAMIHVIIKEKLYDEAFVKKWTYGFDRLAGAVESWSPEKASAVTWVPAETIRKVARMFATLKPAAMHESNGIDQHPSVFQTTRAMDCLVAITGNLNRRGAMVLDPWARPAGFQPWRDMTLRNPSPEVKQVMGKRSVSTYPFYYNMFYGGISHIMDALATGKPYPIRALVAQGINPMVTNDDHCKVADTLRKVPFLAVLDTVMTPTCRIADLVLPAATYLEKDALLKWAFRAKPRVDRAFFGLQRKVVEPRGEAKSEFDFFRDLMWAMGHRDEWPFKTMQEWVDYELEPMGLSFEKLAEDPGKIIWKTFSDDELGEEGLKRFLQLPSFPQHKIPLYSDFLEKAEIDPLPRFEEVAESPMTDPDLARDYPLVAMASIKPGVFVHAQYRTLPWLRDILPEPFVEIHPETAAELDVQEGETVRVESLRGSIELKARLIRTMDRKAVALTHGWWEPVTNVLTPSEFRDPVCGATSNHCFQVRISKRRK